ncbi:cell division protein [Robbsia andropogonis]|uniref:Cell division protein n=1 Tax=Robbsia andropogonis TaxID=28092 RepID=A0A0F5K2W5_9BURK|nr:translesion DNA synthesis-associated protein ImuA [Robbsia andropogonis]KKB64270.1 cell division protein [Robbsia andropogonis]MCP1118857.1 translesion DNA synthesis-associated protein ImuA [Robbsia andropogonis]MCP1128324.1 translesion DNA synthesis-associated protein ImuA [Robbsia andropogonis]
MQHATLQHPETIHPSLWRASQLAQAKLSCIAPGDSRLAVELPGGGWPVGSLTELLLPQAGIGEFRLLRPALQNVAARPLMMLCPPHIPNQQAFQYWGLPIAQWQWVRANRTADALWAAEQILRTGGCGALLFWQDPIRPEALRRLHLAAQASSSLFFLFRPLNAAHRTSPAPLRLALQPAPDGLSVTFVKRRGPTTEQSLVLSLSPSPILLNRHASLDRRLSAAPASRSISADLVQ